MELTLRPAATAAVALSAAALIAVAPVTPPVPALEVSAPRVVSEAVGLMVDPVTVYTDLIENTVGNTATIGVYVLNNLLGNNPDFPGVSLGFTSVLLALVQNEAFYAANIGSIIASPGHAITTDTIPGLIAAAQALASFDFSGALTDFVGAIAAPFIALVNVPGELVTGVGEVAALIATHIGNVTTTAIPTSIGLIGAAILNNPLTATVTATGTAIGDIVTALSPFDPLGLASAFVSAPGIIANGFLNGTGGLLAPPPGPIQTFQAIQQTFVKALDGPAPGATAAAAVPNLHAKTATVNVVPNTGGSGPVTTSGGTNNGKPLTVNKPNTQVKTLTAPVDTVLKSVTGSPGTLAKTAGNGGGQHHTDKTAKK